ncbi:MAG: phosphoglucosamine mutase [Gammaproteobacteria bacterium]|nr:phosphoglucosamine mutase [Gammaproteobacteria bacterium]
MAVRKYFGTDGIRGRVGDAQINPSFVLKLGWAIGSILGKKKTGKVLIGKDTRISGYMLESALEAGLSSAGMNIHLLGPMPTPAIAYLTRTLRAEAGIVISASHNPYHDNGIKLFSNQGTKLPDSVELAIENQLDKPMITMDSAGLGKAARIVDAPGRYIEFCKSTVSQQVNLAGLKIVVDCANGATYHIAPHVFRELGADVIEIGTHPDGFNINEQGGSTQPELLQKIVVTESADVGIAFDGDGDRVIMVDHKGEVVDGDEEVYIMVNNLIASKTFRGGVVGTAMSNLGLEVALKRMNIPFKRTKVGDRYILAELAKNSWLVGGEPSGHIVNLGLTTTGDGIISALQVLSAMCKTGQTLHDLKLGMVKYPQVLINISTSNADRALKSALIKRMVKDIEKQLGKQGRVLLRPSGTEPVVRVMVEGEQKQMVHVLAKELAAMVQRECA